MKACALLPVFVPYDIPFKNIQDMAYGTNEIVTYGMRSLPYGIIYGGGDLQVYSENVWAVEGRSDVQDSNPDRDGAMDTCNGRKGGWKNLFGSGDWS